MLHVDLQIESGTWQN